MVENNTPNINWYPGHMTKARRAMQEDIKLIDLVIELLDARIPLASRNPDIDSMSANKKRMILLNKADLANETITLKWIKYFKDLGYEVVPLDSRNRNKMNDVLSSVMVACKDKIERDRKRGILNRPIRAMIVGIPNVGKSTFINSFAKKAVAKTGNKPGVTKGKQWIRLNKDVELLDTPGILWPKFEDKEVGVKLALIGSINDQILNIEELSLDLIERLRKISPGLVSGRFEVEEEGSAYEVLENIGRRRGALKKGSEIDTEKAANILIDEYRSGKLGRISLEVPKEESI
ncbi:MAG: ribosome biogenesis GTPase YlqF [Lachnospiraceae bacterium]|nr:ribosome biogenesis GTPase YlqF [Lachnospiraceae bacterium]